jgi:hypothetical protein
VYQGTGHLDVFLKWALIFPLNTLPQNLTRLNGNFSNKKTLVFNVSFIPGKIIETKTPFLSKQVIKKVHIMVSMRDRHSIKV